MKWRATRHWWSLLSYWLNGHGFEQIPEDSGGQRSLACCSLWGHKESDTTEWLNWTEGTIIITFLSCFLSISLLFEVSHLRTTIVFSSTILFFFFFWFGCTGSSLRHAGSLVVTCRLYSLTKDGTQASCIVSIGVLTIGPPWKSQSHLFCCPHFPFEEVEA